MKRKINKGYKLPDFNIVIYRAGNGFVVDSLNREDWMPDASLPWLATGEDDTEVMMDLLGSIMAMFDPNAKVIIERTKEKDE